jgi:hypothetical protein
MIFWPGANVQGATAPNIGYSFAVKRFCRVVANSEVIAAGPKESWNQTPGGYDHQQVRMTGGLYAEWPEAVNKKVADD